MYSSIFLSIYTYIFTSIDFNLSEVDRNFKILTYLRKRKQESKLQSARPIRSYKKFLD